MRLTDENVAHRRKLQKQMKQRKRCRDKQTETSAWASQFSKLSSDSKRAIKSGTIRMIVRPVVLAQRTSGPIVTSKDMLSLGFRHINGRSIWTNEDDNKLKSALIRLHNKTDIILLLLYIFCRRFFGYLHHCVAQLLLRNRNCTLFVVIHNCVYFKH